MLCMEIDQRFAIFAQHRFKAGSALEYQKQTPGSILQLCMASIPPLSEYAASSMGFLWRCSLLPAVGFPGIAWLFVPSSRLGVTGASKHRRPSQPCSILTLLIHDGMKQFIISLPASRT